MNESIDLRGADQPKALRVRITEAFAASTTACDIEQSSPRRDLLRLMVCWLDDRDGQVRADGQEKGCSDDAILEFLQGLHAQKQKSRDANLSAAKFVEAHEDLAEIRIIDEFLPRKLKADALGGEVKDIIAQLGAKKLKDLPACMNALERRFPGQIDPKLASGLVKKALG